MNFPSLFLGLSDAATALAVSLQDHNDYKVLEEAMLMQRKFKENFFTFFTEEEASQCHQQTKWQQQVYLTKTLNVLDVKDSQEGVKVALLFDE